ncbi:GNAT family N-acetyltransferase [Leuconostoc fallax]|uniref:GNAT family N-acetyltransferase n=1 Tax=Leuconostoc fallax TaxID=1251 RepID=UPI002090BD46|nr:GNAT family N-acetyltransferase [Leuconostoc fallax]MCO6183660.1 GNAT family N-acetyltransferase [Leuconostoc fallax]
MKSKAFQEYISFAVNEYAKEKIEVGSWSTKQAQQNAQMTYDRLLPKGLNTPHHFLYSIYDDTVIVGYIWFGADNENQSRAFIFDFEIYHDYQNNGFGSQALKLVSNEAKKMGFDTIGLHVFGNNDKAIHVYQKSGFDITDIKMQKKI